MRQTGTPALKLLEVVANERCPCGHLKQRHRKAIGRMDGEVMGPCRDCDCNGLIDCTDDEQ